MSEPAKKVQSMVTADQGGILAIIEKMALNPDVDPVKVEKFLDMQERIYRINAEVAFNQAMAKCQSEIPAIKKTSKNTQTGSLYAKLEKLQAIAGPVLAANGFSLSFGTKDCPLLGHYRITCIVSHSGGHSHEYFADIPLDDVGLKGQKNKTMTHGVGSSLTYGQRYLMQMIFNIQVTGMDNDGNNPASLITEQQVLDLQALVDEVGEDGKKALFKWAEIENISELPANKYQQAVAALERRRKK